METFACNRCGYSTDNISNLRRHIRRKLLCKPKVADISIETLKNDFLPEQKNKTLSCANCGKSYASRQGLYLHLKSESCSQTDTNKSTSLDAIKHYEDVIKDLSDQVTKKDECIANLQEKLHYQTSKRNEDFYQAMLEKHFNATHKRLSVGITDITTDDAHIEIKRWSCWKEALSQLLLYNRADPKEHIHACFFEKCTEALKKLVVDNFITFGIEVYEFVESEDAAFLRHITSKEVVQVYGETAPMHAVVTGE